MWTPQPYGESHHGETKEHWDLMVRKLILCRCEARAVIQPPLLCDRNMSQTSCCTNIHLAGYRNTGQVFPSLPSPFSAGQGSGTSPKATQHHTHPATSNLLQEPSPRQGGTHRDMAMLLGAELRDTEGEQAQSPALGLAGGTHTVVDDVVIHQLLHEADAGLAVGRFLVLDEPVRELLGHKAVGVRPQVVPPVLDQLPIVETKPGGERHSWALRGGWV